MTLCGKGLRPASSMSRSVSVPSPGRRDLGIPSNSSIYLGGPGHGGITALDGGSGILPRAGMGPLKPPLRGSAGSPSWPKSRGHCREDVRGRASQPSGGLISRRELSAGPFLIGSSDLRSVSSCRPYGTTGFKGPNFEGVDGGSPRSGTRQNAIFSASIRGGYMNEKNPMNVRWQRKPKSKPNSSRHRASRPPAESSGTPDSWRSSSPTCRLPIRRSTAPGRYPMSRDLPTASDSATWNGGSGS